MHGQTRFLSPDRGHLSVLDMVILGRLNLANYRYFLLSAVDHS